MAAGLCPPPLLVLFMGASCQKGKGKVVHVSAQRALARRARGKLEETTHRGLLVPVLLIIVPARHDFVVSGRVEDPPRA